MNDKRQEEDAIRCASAALTLARKVRAHADGAAPGRPCGAARRSLRAIVEVLGTPECFSEAFLDELRDVFPLFEEEIARGTTVGIEVHDAWTENGTETTTVRSIDEVSPEARHLAVVLAHLRQLAGLIEATLDLVAAEAIVAILRRGS